MPNIVRTGQRDVSLVVWVGIIGLLFLAVAMYEGWIGASGSLTPGSSDPVGDPGVSFGGGGGSSDSSPGLWSTFAAWIGLSNIDWLNQ